MKEDPYFKTFEWNKLISFSLSPPYKIKFKPENLNNTKGPYLAYLKEQDVKKWNCGKKKLSVRGAEF